MRIEPHSDGLLVRVLESGNRTRGGLYIPDMATDGTPWLRAEVAAVGPGHYTSQGVLVPQRAKVGDVIVFWRNAKEQIVFPDDDGKELLFIRAGHVMGFVMDLDKVTSITSVEGRNLVLSS